jgi:hypothetical protein
MVSCANIANLIIYDALTKKPADSELAIIIAGIIACIIACIIAVIIKAIKIANAHAIVAADIREGYTNAFFRHDDYAASIAIINTAKHSYFYGWFYVWVYGESV